MKWIIILIISPIVFLHCQSNSGPSFLNLGDHCNIVFLDSLTASEAIVTDDVDHFFNRVTLTEMEIQMKGKNVHADRDSMVFAYKNFLRTDVLSFTEEEIKDISKVFLEIGDMLRTINPKLLDRDIILIKTKGNHYGNSVYYTRENKIIIPVNELLNFNKESFTHVMLHEYAHVFNRYNKSTRDSIYSLIDFQEITGNIVLPSHLNQTKLLNPDGTTDYYIPLTTTSGKKVLAYPLLNAKHEHFIATEPSFFNYLNFELYDLDLLENGNYKLIVNEDGRSTIPFDEIPDFFSKITDNTNYIIHPDEIMADNFIYAVYYAAKDKKIKSFSDAGMSIINQLIVILKNYGL